MKESEFIELLNLYIDHEITAEDASRLEVEVTTHPEHRRIYLQYCRMHRACGVLAEQFRESTPDAAAVLAPHSNPWRGALYATGLMAAAGLAVAVGFRWHRIRETSSLAPEVAVAAPAPAPVAVASSETAVTPLHPAVDLRDLSLFSGNNGRTVRVVSLPAAPSEAALAASEQNQLNEMFAWMNQVRMPPVQRPPLEQAFTASPVLIEPDNRAMSNQDARVYNAAFRFER